MVPIANGGFGCSVAMLGPRARDGDGGAIAIRLCIGCPVIGYCLQDTVWILSRAEQIVQGQLPHRDYFAFHGVAPFVLVAGGILLVGCRGLAITVAFALLAPVAAAAGWFLSRTRLPAVMAASFSIMLGVQLLFEHRHRAALAARTP